jgi:hypothetical protein
MESGSPEAFDLDPDDVAPPVPMEQCFVFFDGKLRANENGRKRFKERFQRAGFDIDKIRTFEELDAALRGSFHIVLGDLERAFERRAAGRDSLDHQAVRAWNRGEYEKVKALMDRRERATQLGLEVVQGGGPRNVGSSG